MTLQRLIVVLRSKIDRYKHTEEVVFGNLRPISLGTCLGLEEREV